MNDLNAMAFQLICVLKDSPALISTSQTLYKDCENQ